MEDIKQILVVRRDLKSRRGKECAQSAHASNQFLLERILNGQKLKPVEQLWADTGIKKVTVQVDTLEELEEIFQKGKNAGIETHIIVDSGTTEYHGNPTKTVVALGPDYASKLDPITGSLKLY